MDKIIGQIILNRVPLYRKLIRDKLNIDQDTLEQYGDDYADLLEQTNKKFAANNNITEDDAILCFTLGCLGVAADVFGVDVLEIYGYEEEK